MCLSLAHLQSHQSRSGRQAVSDHSIAIVPTQIDQLRVLCQTEDVSLQCILRSNFRCAYTFRWRRSDLIHQYLSDSTGEMWPVATETSMRWRELRSHWYHRLQERACLCSISVCLRWFQLSQPGWLALGWVGRVLCTSIDRGLIDTESPTLSLSSRRVADQWGFFGTPSWRLSHLTFLLPTQLSIDSWCSSSIHSLWSLCLVCTPPATSWNAGSSYRSAPAHQDRNDPHSTVLLLVHTNFNSMSGP